MHAEIHRNQVFPEICMEQLSCHRIAVPCRFRGRLEACIDLVAEEAVYDKQCYDVNFITGRSIPKENNVQIPKSVDEKKMAAFEALCAWMENSSELYSISELHEVMAELAGRDEDVYSEKTPAGLLLKKYEGKVVLTQVAGRANAPNIQQHQASVNDSNRNLAKDWVPNLLIDFIETIIPNVLKTIAICHSMVQAARLWTALSPLLFTRNSIYAIARIGPLHSTPLTGRAIKPQCQGHIGGPIAQP